jgi:hypothetical protein
MRTQAYTETRPGPALLLVAIAAMVLPACGGGYDIPDTPLGGIVGGQGWQLGTAETDPGQASEDGLWVDAYAEMIAPCTGGPSSTTSRLILTVPPAVGEHRLSATHTATFVVYSGSQIANLGAMNGTIVVDEISDVLVRGGAFIEYDGENKVSGRFTISVCP